MAVSRKYLIFIVMIALLAVGCREKAVTPTTTTTPTTGSVVATTPGDTTTTTTSTVAPKANVEIEATDQTVSTFEVTVTKVQTDGPVAIVVVSDTGETVASRDIDPGSYEQLTLPLLYSDSESPLTDGVARTLVILAEDDRGEQLASTTVDVTLHLPTTNYELPKPPTDSEAGGLTVRQERRLIETEGVALVDTYLKTLAHYIVGPELGEGPSLDTIRTHSELAVSGPAQAFLETAGLRAAIYQSCRDNKYGSFCTDWAAHPQLRSELEDLYTIRLMSEQKMAANGIGGPQGPSVSYAGNHRWVVSAAYNLLGDYGYPRHFILDVVDGHPTLIDLVFQKHNIFTKDSHTVGELAPPFDTMYFTPAPGIGLDCRVSVATGQINPLGMTVLYYIMECTNTGDITLSIPTEKAGIDGTRYLAPRDVVPALYGRGGSNTIIVVPWGPTEPGDTTLVSVKVLLSSLDARELVTIDEDLWPDNPDHSYEGPEFVGTFSYRPSKVKDCYLCDFTPVPES